MNRRTVILLSLLPVSFIFCGSLLMRLSAHTNSSILFINGKDDLNVRLILIFEQKNPLMAHYTEHLAWLPNIGKNSGLGSRSTNAWTNSYTVGYWLAGTTNDLAIMLGRLKIVFDPLRIPPEFAEQEKDILEREYDFRVGTNMNAIASRDMESFLYEGNQIAIDSLGTPETIQNLSYKDAKAFHADTHLPQRARLVVIGNVPKSRILKAMAEVDFPEINGNGGNIKPPPFTMADSETKIFRYHSASSASRMIWRKVIKLPQPVDFDLLEAQTALARDILDTNLPGGIAGPLRFDGKITRSFSVAFNPIDESHVELIFASEPDTGISFSTLQTAFETAISSSTRDLVQATYSRVNERFKGFWPDWSDKEKTAQWMENYVISRVMMLRDVKTESELRKIKNRLQFSDIISLFELLTGPGRTAVAFIGLDPNP